MAPIMEERSKKVSKSKKKSATSKMAAEPSLPILLALDKADHSLDDRVRKALSIARVDLEDGHGNQLDTPDAQTAQSISRCDFVLRWLLEKLKTVEGRSAFRESNIAWDALRSLITVLPAGRLFRNIQSSHFLRNIADFLLETADLSTTAQNSGPIPEANDTEATQKSKKRKRGEKEPSPNSRMSAENWSAARRQALAMSILGSTASIKYLCYLRDDMQAKGSEMSIDTISAARLLKAWFACLGTLPLDDPDYKPLIGDSHEAMLYIWQHRSIEADDKLGLSAEPFSKQCLTSFANLLLTAKVPSFIEESLKRLFCIHVLVPAHTLFQETQDSRKPDVLRARTALHQYLEPLRVTVERAHEKEKVCSIPKVLPSFLGWAIDLCTGGEPVAVLQQDQILWVEAVFTELSMCALEPLPHDETHRSNGCSRLGEMLQVLKTHDIKLSEDFLESILMGYSGLEGLRKGNQQLRFDVVAPLLDLNGDIFLKRRVGATTDPSLDPTYVDALMNSMSNLSYTSQGQQDIVRTGKSMEIQVDYAVHHILIPLLRAYSSSRKLTSFVSLWFWEIRRKWQDIGTANEKHCPWLSRSLLHEFQAHLEKDLVPARINETLVEFVLPIKQLLDERAAYTDTLPEWKGMKNIAPSSSALVIMEALLYSINTENVLKQQDKAAWLGLERVLIALLRFDLDGFGAESRVWSIMTRMHILSSWVEGKEQFLLRQENLIGSKTSLLAIVVEKERKLADVDFDHDAAHGQRLRYLMTVCNFEVAPAFQTRARSFISAMSQSFLASIDLPKLRSFDRFKGPLRAPQEDRVMQTASLVVQYPESLLALDPEPRQTLFKAIAIDAQLEARRSPHLRWAAAALRALTETLVSDGPKACLDELVEVLITEANFAFVTDGYDHQEGVALDTLLLIPAPLIARTRREAYLDTAQVVGTTDSDWLIPKRLALATRLLRCQNPTAKLCMAGTPIFKIADALDSNFAFNKPDVDLLQAAAGMFDAVFRQAIAESTSERQNAFMSDIVGLFDSTYEIEDSLILKHPARVLLLQSWLTHTCYASGTSDALGQYLPMCEGILDSLIRTCQKAIESKESKHICWTLCFALNKITELLYSRAESHGVLETMLREKFSEPQFKQTFDRLMSASMNKNRPWTSELMQLILTIGDNVYPLPSPNDDGSKEKTAVDRMRTLCRTADRLGAAPLPQRLKLLKSLLATGSQTDLQMVQIILSSIKSKDQEVMGDWKQIIPRLCEIAISTAEHGLFTMAMLIIEDMLKNRSYMVTQHGVDTLLRAVTTVSSASSPAFDKEKAGHIFRLLCSLATTAVHLHRQRLGGRMQLLIPLLQNLMTCLFTPHRYSSSALAALPPWLSLPNTLGAEQAAGYTKLLNTLTSPTASSASSMSKRGFAMPSLTDEKKGVKEYVGRFVPYVLLHYCKLRLEANVEPELHERMKMGIWGMMDVVDIEAMRGMNAGMSRDERVVWGTVYAEWMKQRGRSIAMN